MNYDSSDRKLEIISLVMRAILTEAYDKDLCL